MKTVTRIFTAAEIKSGIQVRMIPTYDVNSFTYVSQIRIKVIGDESSSYFNSSSNPQLKIHYGTDSNNCVVLGYSLPCEVGDIKFDKIFNADREINIDSYTREQIVAYDDNNNPIINPATRINKKGLDINVTPSQGITGDGVPIEITLCYKTL